MHVKVRIRRERKNDKCYAIFVPDMPADLSIPMDINERIDSSRCGKIYRDLEDCLVKADRDWRRCQHEVKVFRECMNRMKAVQTDSERCE